MGQDESKIVSGFNNLVKDGGVRQQDGFPMEFQLTDVPKLGDGYGLGNNQAYLFISNPAGNTDPDKMKLNTQHLETLMRNAKENNTAFTLMIDDDVMTNPTKFVEKYHMLRGEDNVEDKKALLLREAELISGFIKDGGLKELANKVVDNDVVAAKNMLTKNFKFQTVKVEEALEQGMFSATTLDGDALIAVQNYKTNTHSTDRKWQLGTKNQAKELAQNGDELASTILSAQQAVKDMDKVQYLASGTALGGAEKSSEIGR